MYVADLEAKVAAYEKAEIDRSVEIQKAAQRLKEDNDALKKENANLRERALQLERIILSMRAAGGVVPPLISPSPRSGPGCKAPAHEEPRRQIVPLKKALSSGRPKGDPKGAVRFADQVDQSNAQGGSPTRVQLPRPTVPSRPIQAGPSSPLPEVGTKAAEATAMPLSHNKRTAPSKPLWALKPSAPPAAVEQKPSVTLLSPPSMDTQPVHVEGGCGFCTEASPCVCNSDIQQQPVVVEGGCGFCTEASPCVCTGDVLDLDGGVKDETNKTVKSCSGSSSKEQPEQASPARLPSVTSMALPLQRRKGATGSRQAQSMRVESLTNPEPRTTGKKLWYTVPAAEQARLPAVCPTPSHASLTSKVAAATSQKPKKKLWPTIPASTALSFTASSGGSKAGVGDSGGEPVCTGDPKSCAACSTDPGLAAFCEAVANSVKGSSTTFTTWDEGDAKPLRLKAAKEEALPGIASLQSQVPVQPGPGNYLKPPSTYTRPSWQGRTETIPWAWRQIRSHPRFEQWQGGLDLLAEVVSKRSGSVKSPSLGERERERGTSVEIERVPLTRWGSNESHDRTTTRAPDASAGPGRLIHSASDTMITKVSDGKRGVVGMEVDQDEKDDDGRANKRRRIVVEREAVEEALALLDRGTAQLPVLTSALPPRTYGHSHESGDLPCPCPWWRPGERAPQPKAKEE